MRSVLRELLIGIKLFALWLRWGTPSRLLHAKEVNAWQDAFEEHRKIHHKWQDTRRNDDIKAKWDKKQRGHSNGNNQNDVVGASIRHLKMALGKGIPKPWKREKKVDDVEQP